MKEKLIISNIKWLFSDKIIGIILGFVLNVWIARIIGVEDYGRIATVLAVMALAEPVCNLCIRTKIVAMLILDEGRDSFILSNTFAITLVISLMVSCGISLLATLFIQDATIKIITIIFSTSLLFKSFGFAEYYFESKLWAKYLFKARRSAFAISLIIKLLVVYFFNSSIILVAGSIAIEECLYSILLYNILCTILYKRI